MSKKLQQLVILVGVDWGSQFHQACILNQEGDRLGEKKFSHSGEGIQGFVDWILDHADGYAEHIGVGIEVPHGPIVEALLGRGIHVFSINPKQLPHGEHPTDSGIDSRLQGRKMIAKMPGSSPMPSGPIWNVSVNWHLRIPKSLNCVSCHGSAMN